MGSEGGTNRVSQPSLPGKVMSILDLDTYLARTSKNIFVTFLKTYHLNTFDFRGCTAAPKTVSSEHRTCQNEPRMHTCAHAPKIISLPSVCRSCWIPPTACGMLPFQRQGAPAFRLPGTDQNRGTRFHHLGHLGNQRSTKSIRK